MDEKKRGGRRKTRTGQGKAEQGRAGKRRDGTERHERRG